MEAITAMVLLPPPLGPQCNALAFADGEVDGIHFTAYRRTQARTFLVYFAPHIIGRGFALGASFTVFSTARKIEPRFALAPPQCLHPWEKPLMA
ncbi:MAG: hypothetical protein IPO90_12945 [Flavobacteriales bacterium]|nr:hypothetical protein [Flavobacteriales bacterium]